MIIDKLSVKEYLEISLLMDEYKDNDAKLNKELVKYFYKDKKPFKKDGEKTIESLNKLLSKEAVTVLRFKHNGVEYGMEPNLENCPWSVYIDADTYLKGNTLDRFMSVLYRPVIKVDNKNRYRIEDYEGSDKYLDVMREVDYKVLEGLLFFFTHLRKSLLNASDTYLKKEMLRMNMKEIKSKRKNKSLTKSSVGMV